MDFSNEVKVLADKFSARVSHLDTEEATKNSLVLPFFQLLGYDIFDPTEVIPEFKVKVAAKQGGRVDYALFLKGKPALLVECNTYGTSHSDEHLSQLLSCLRVTDARFGLLTDGISYSFYSDLDHQNSQESLPFFEMNFLDYTESQAMKLRQFAKSKFHEDKSVAQAYRQKYLKGIQIRISHEFADPTDDFIRFIMSSEFPGSFTQQGVKHLRPLFQEASNRIIDENVASRSNPPPYFAESPKKPEPTEQSTELINWTSIDKVSHVTHRDPPIAIRFGESESQPIDYWREVLREATVWLVRTGRLSSEDLPIGGSGYGFPFINSVPRSPNGPDYWDPQRVFEGIYIETNYNANNLIEYTKKLLAHHSTDLETIELRFG